MESDYIMLFNQRQNRLFTLQGGFYFAREVAICMRISSQSLVNEAPC